MAEVNNALTRSVPLLVKSLFASTYTFGLLSGPGWLPELLPQAWVAGGISFFFISWTLLCGCFYGLAIRPLLQAIKLNIDELQSQKDHHSREFTQSPAALVAMDTAGGLLEVNSAACALMGVPRGWSEGALPDFVYESDRSIVETTLHELTAGEREFKSIELRLLDPKGRLSWALVTFRVSRDAKGRIDRLQAVLFDTHKLKGQLQKLEQNYREARGSLETLQHFLMARGMSLARQCDIAVLHLQPPDIQTPVSNAQYLSELHSLMFEGRLMCLGAQYHMGTLNVQRHDFDLHVELRPLLARWQRIAEHKGLKWHLDYQDSGRWSEYYGDGTGIIILLHALLDMSIAQATSGDMTVRVILNKGDKQDRLSIVIQAPVSSPLTRSEDDLGSQFLVMLLHDWAERLDGRLQLDFDPGKGAWVSLSVRLEQAKKQDNARQVVDDVLSLESSTILLVEDTPINQMIVEEALSSKGYQVIVAHNGEDALVKLKNHPDISLILMDIQMPVMDGVKCTETIRSMSAYEHLPIIALTANREQETRDTCLKVGMNDFLVKPIHPDRLVSIIQQFLKQQNHPESDSKSNPRQQQSN